MNLPSDSWTVAILSSREHWSELKACIDAALASEGLKLCFEVVINGNPDLAKLAANWLKQETNVAHRIRVWSIEMGDKANAWNTLVHSVITDRGGCFFLDGYVRVNSNALQRMVAALHAEPSALAVAAVPSVGRSARQMRHQMMSEGGLHGNLFGLTANTMSVLRKRSIRLPIGMYRTDSTLGAMLSFGLNPADHEWQPLQNICLAADATWWAPQTSWSSARQLLTQWRRVRRQARGHLENMAVRHHLAVRRRPPETLGRHIRDVVETWKQEAPSDFKHARGLHPLRWLEQNNWPAATSGSAVGQRSGDAALLMDRA